MLPGQEGPATRLSALGLSPGLVTGGFLSLKWVDHQEQKEDNFDMKKSLAETNPFLRDPAIRKKGIRRMVESSSKVEGIQVKLGSEADEDVSTGSLSKPAKMNKDVSE